MTETAQVAVGQPSHRRTAGNVAAVAVAQVVGKALSLAWIVVAARELPQRDYGEFSFVFSLALILSAVAEWGFDPVLVRLASRRPGDVDRHYTEAVVAQAMVGLVLFGVVLAAVMPSRPNGHDQLAMALVFLAIFVDVWNDTARSVGAAVAKQGRTSVALMVQRLATAALVLGLLAAHTGIAGLAGGLLGGTLVGWVATLIALRSFGTRLRFTSLTRRQFASFVRLSIPVGVSSLVLILVARIDTVLLEVLRGSSVVAAYATSYKLFEASLLVTFAVSSATFPLMSAATDPARVASLVRAAVGTMSVFLIPFAVACLVDAPGVLRLIFGARYEHQSAGALRWLAVAPLMYALAYSVGTGLIALGRNRGLIVSSLVAAVVNVAINLAVIPRWAGTGAAFVTTLSYAAEAAVGLVLLQRTTGAVRAVPAVAEAAVAGVLMGAVLWAMPGPVLVEIPVGVVAYLAVWALIARRRRSEQWQFLLGLMPGRWAR